MREGPSLEPVKGPDPDSAPNPLSQSPARAGPLLTPNCPSPGSGLQNCPHRVLGSVRLTRCPRACVGIGWVLPRRQEKPEEGGQTLWSPWSAPHPPLCHPRDRAPMTT